MCTEKRYTKFRDFGTLSKRVSAFLKRLDREEGKAKGDNRVKTKTTMIFEYADCYLSTSLTQ
jgi:hypothetical protein